MQSVYSTPKNGTTAESWELRSSTYLYPRFHLCLLVIPWKTYLTFQFFPALRWEISTGLARNHGKYTLNVFSMIYLLDYRLSKYHYYNAHPLCYTFFSLCVNVDISDCIVMQSIGLHYNQHLVIQWVTREYQACWGYGLYP